MVHFEQRATRSQGLPHKARVRPGPEVVVSDTPAPSTERKLLPQHLTDLGRSGITEATARAARVYSESDPAEVSRLLGWGRPAVELGPCMVFPYFEPDGTEMMYRRADGTLGQVVSLKPTTPRLDPTRNNRQVKYESPIGCGNHLYIPRGTDPAALQVIRPSVSASAPPPSPAAGQAQPEAPVEGAGNRRGRPRRGASAPRQLVVAEGVKKALRLYQAGLLVVAISGTWSWTNRPPDDAAARQPGQLRELIEDICNLVLAARDIYILMDSDAHTSAQRHQPIEEFARALQGRGARAYDVVLPLLAGMQKTGADDYLMAPNLGLANLLALINRAAAIRQRPQYLDAGANHAYEVRAGSIYHMRATAHGTIPQQLCNFTANILCNVLRDDGQERVRQYEIEGRLETGQPLPRVRVLAEQFASMNWVASAWGSDARILPGNGIRDHLAYAIQILSAGVPERTVYTHTGWARIEDRVDGQPRVRWAFLHDGGAIGADGVEVHYDPPLDKFRLPEPPTGEALVKAVRADLRLLNLAPDHISFPGLVAVYRIVLGHADFSLHISGETGIFKTEYAALLQRHFGVELGVGNLPAAWSSTANHLESVAFALKDVPMAVDDYGASGGRADLEKMKSAAERLLRGVGNRTGRGRARPDGSPRPTRFPRALVISTGEDIPPGHSLRARFASLALRKGDITSERLTVCQRDADDGLYAQAMAGFIAWMVPQYESLKIKDEVAALRTRPVDGQHARTPTLVANLTLGLEYMVSFALEIGAITEAEAKDLRRRGAVAFTAVADTQTEIVREDNPAIRFLSYIAAALTTGVANLEAATEIGGQPRDPQRYGWTAGGQPRPGSRLIGWTDGEAIYLSPDAAYAAAQQMAGLHGTALTRQPRALWGCLKEGGFLLSWDPERNTIRRTLGGVAKRAVLHLDASKLYHHDDDSEGGEEDDSDARTAGQESDYTKRTVHTVHSVHSGNPAPQVQSNDAVTETGPGHGREVTPDATVQTVHSQAQQEVHGLHGSPAASGEPCTDTDSTTPTGDPSYNTENVECTECTVCTVQNDRGDSGAENNNSLPPAVEVREMGDEDAI
jgi:hypothetical protein